MIRVLHFDMFPRDRHYLWTFGVALGLASVVLRLLDSPRGGTVGEFVDVTLLVLGPLVLIDMIAHRPPADAPRYRKRDE